MRKPTSGPVSSCCPRLSPSRLPSPPPLQEEIRLGAFPAHTPRISADVRGADDGGRKVSARSGMGHRPGRQSREGPRQACTTKTKAGDVGSTVGDPRAHGGNKIP